MNLTMLLEMASSLGERRALTSGGRHLGFGELFAAAGAVRDLVVESGAAQVAFLDESSPALPISLFASAWAGVPFAPLNYRLTGDELDALLTRVSPALLVTDAERAVRLADRPGISAISGDALLERAGAGVAVPGEWPMDPEAIAVLLFTSGTTGAPKAAVLRHQHLVSYVLGTVEFASAAEDDATLVAVPPYHIAGIAAIVSSVYAGRRIVQLPRFDPREWLRLAREERVTNAFVVPTMLARIVEVLEAGGSEPPGHLRALSYGGGKMPLPVIERAMRLLPDTDFTNAYGLTETSSTVTLLGPEDHRDAAASADPGVRRRLASVGRALPNVEIEIRDEEGRPVAPGAVGEIHVRGEQVAGEYLEQGSRLDRDGWFPTRDAGSLDGAGYLFLEGRIDDVIVRGGENMSPGEIEDVLLAHEAVGDAAVVGVPDPQWGESVAAAVVLREGATASEAELQQWVKERLRSSRTPEHIAFVRELPYNETGKLLRRVVRERLLA